MSIWNTIECSAWSRDFCYNEYLAFHKKTGIVATPVSLNMYLNLCSIFDQDMDDYTEGDE